MLENKTNNYEIKRKDGTIKKYDYISDFVNGFAAVKSNSKWGYIDEAGNEICPIKYEMEFDINKRESCIRFFHEGFVAVAEVWHTYFLRYGYINTNGKEMIPLRYLRVSDFHNGIAYVMEGNNKISLINRKFKTITKRQYAEIRPFINGFAVVKYNGLCGFINEKGDEIIEPKYESLTSFGKLGYAQFTKRYAEFDKVFFVDTNGKEYFSHFYSDEMILLN